MKKWPKLASIKFDGVRGVTNEQGLLSNSLKRIPNAYVQHCLSVVSPYLDGELVLRGDKGKVYDNNQSAFMSRGGRPDFVFKVFDCAIDPNAPFEQRLERAKKLGKDFEFIEVVEHELLVHPQEALDMYEVAREEGYEGLILRDPTAKYKFGRSTKNQEWSMKMKPFDPDEARVVGFTELYHNENTQYDNEMGYAVRSSHQDNKVPGDVLGALICSYNGNEFRIGTGFDAATRADIWHNKAKYKNKIVRFKHQGITKAGVPRGPAVFLGWRNELDMSEQI